MWMNGQTMMLPCFVEGRAASYQMSSINCDNPFDVLRGETPV